MFLHYISLFFLWVCFTPPSGMVAKKTIRFFFFLVRFVFFSLADLRFIDRTNMQCSALRLFLILSVHVVLSVGSIEGGT